MEYKVGDINYVHATHKEKINRTNSIEKFIKENPLEDIGMCLRNTSFKDFYILKIIEAQQKSIDILLKRIEFLEEDMNYFNFKVSDYLSERDPQ